MIRVPLIDTLELAEFFNSLLGVINSTKSWLDWLRSACTASAISPFFSSDKVSLDNVASRWPSKFLLTGRMDCLCLG